MAMLNNQTVHCQAADVCTRPVESLKSGESLEIDFGEAEILELPACREAMSSEDVDSLQVELGCPWHFWESTARALKKSLDICIRTQNDMQIPSTKD